MCQNSKNSHEKVFSRFQIPDMAKIIWNNNQVYVKLISAFHGFLIIQFKTLAPQHLSLLFWPINSQMIMALNTTETPKKNINNYHINRYNQQPLSQFPEQISWWWSWGLFRGLGTALLLSSAFPFSEVTDKRSPNQKRKFFDSTSSTVCVTCIVEKFQTSGELA